MKKCLIQCLFENSINENEPLIPDPVDDCPVP